MCRRLWQGDCTCKQVVNRLKIPQGLSTLLFHRWSEVPSRGGVRGDSLYEKLPALRRCHLSVFSKCCFLELLSWPSSIRTLFRSGFVVLLSILYDCSSQNGFRRAPFWLVHFLAFLGLLQPSCYCCYLVVLLCLAFHRALFILNASFWVFFIDFFDPHPSSSSCDFGLFSVS